MVVFQEEGGAAVAVPVPEKLNWCAHNALYARFLMDVDSKGKAHRRAFCLTKGVCYVCQTDGGVDRAVQLRQIQGIRTQDCQVAKGMRMCGRPKRLLSLRPLLSVATHPPTQLTVGSTKTEEHCILLSVQDEADWLLRLSHDKHNNEQSNDPLLLEQVLHTQPLRPRPHSHTAAGDCRPGRASPAHRGRDPCA